MRSMGDHWRARLRRGGLAALALAGLAAPGLAAMASGWAWPSLPAHVAPPPVPANNAMSAAKITLGRALFYEPALSSTGTLPCAGCHQQARGFTDGEARHVGVSGEMGLRNVPGLANVGWRSPLTWADPNVRTLEQQALVPMTGEAPVEMGMHGADAVLAQRLSASDCYKAMFAKAFPETGGRIDFAAVTAALASFERTMLSFDSPYDRYLRGEQDAIGPDARAGAALFARAGCAECHSGPDLTDNAMHYTGTEDQNEHCGYGMRECDANERPTSQFRTPSLRNVAVTGPWLHDGQSRSIEDAIRRHDPAAMAGLDMGPILAFLDAQTDTHFLHDPALARPEKTCVVPAASYRVASRN